MDDTKIAKVSEKFVDAPFALANREKGFDCLNSLIYFYEGLGFKFPRTFGEWNEGNYAAGWLRNPGHARRVFHRFLMQLGTEADINYLKRGDLLILEGDLSKGNIREDVELAMKEELEKSFPGMTDYIKGLFAGREILSFPAIYLGNDNLLIVFNKGVKVVPFGFFKKSVVSCPRLVK